MRRIEVYEWVKAEGKTYMEKQFKCLASFHQFGLNYEEFETGPGCYSTAVVEYDDGQCDNVPVELIKFLQPLNGETK